MITTTIIPSHSIAVWILYNIYKFLHFIGLSKYTALEQILYVAIIVAVSIFFGWILRRIILYATQRIVAFKNTDGGKEILKQHTLTKCSHFIPPVVFLSLAPFAFDSSSQWLTIIIRIALVYLTITLAVGINSVLTFIFSRYNDKVNTKELPIKGILNVGKGLVWIIAAIVAISIIVHKSPAALLGGMTAFAAVLMLVFKDSILGFVSGIQMSQNDMLRVGDWIVVPNTPANGVVMDVSLTTVKVRNFDNTLIMVPPYTLVSTSFQNWRGMTASGVRRIANNIYINPDSIGAATDDMIEKVSAQYPDAKNFIDDLKKNNKQVAWNPGVAPLNGTIETNLGLFRFDLMSYLLTSDMIDHNKDMMVRVMPMSSEGVPLQIYCFSVTTQWQAYEAVLSAVMEHALLKASEFGLEILSADHLTVDNESNKNQ